MPRQTVPSDRGPKPVGPYSQAVRAGHNVFVSGQIPVNPESGELVKEPIEQAVEQCFRNVSAVLADAGLTLEDVVMVYLYLADMDDFKRVNEVYAGYFPETPPARVALQAARLPLDAPLEMQVIAFEGKQQPAE